MKNNNYELINANGKILHISTDKWHLMSLKKPDDEVRPQCVKVKPPPVYHTESKPKRVILKAVPKPERFKPSRFKFKFITPKPVGLNALELANASGVSKSLVSYMRDELMPYQIGMYYNRRYYNSQAIEYIKSCMECLNQGELAKQAGVSRRAIRKMQDKLKPFLTVHGYKPEAVEVIRKKNENRSYQKRFNLYDMRA